MNFGIYPGSAIGDDAGAIVTGPPDLPDAINDALDELQGPADRPFLVRGYCPFTGGASSSLLSRAPVAVERYLGHGRRLDLVAQYHSADAGIDGYRGFIEGLIDVYGDRIATLQVGEEPNVTTNRCSRPRVWAIFRSSSPNTAGQPGQDARPNAKQVWSAPSSRASPATPVSSTSPGIRTSRCATPVPPIPVCSPSSGS